MKIHLNILGRINKPNHYTNKLNINNIPSFYPVMSHLIPNISFEKSRKGLFFSSSKNMIPRPFTAKTQHKYKYFTENTAQILQVLHWKHRQNTLLKIQYKYCWHHTENTVQIQYSWTQALFCMKASKVDCWRVKKRMLNSIIWEYCAFSSYKHPALCLWFAV